MSRPSDNKNPRLGTVGGEAVIEGVMMKSRERHSIAVRAQDGGIVVKNKPNKRCVTNAVCFACRSYAGS